MDGSESQYVSTRPAWRKKRWALPILVLLILTIAAGVAWSNRVQIADGFIADELDRLGLPATYQIERIGGRTQIISDLVIGDPDAPDLTADRVIVQLRHRFGLPEVDAVTLVKPRLYGRYIEGKLSFGSLDTVIFADTTDAGGLPDLDVTIRDGRGLIESDFGPVGLKLEGKGNLANGFAGILAATAPQLVLSGCDVSGNSLYGNITTSGGEARFQGPMRISLLACRQQDLTISDLAANLDLSSAGELTEQRLTAQISTDEAKFGTSGAQSLSGTVRAQQRDGVFNSRYTLALRGVATSQALAALVSAEGTLRARDGFERFEIESDIEGNGLRLGASLIESLQEVAASGKGTLLQPIASQIGMSLQTEARGSMLSATLRYRSAKDGAALIIPQAEMRGGSGARILSLSRVELSSSGDEPARIAGNVATGGPGLPRITGRMESGSGGDAVFRLEMAPYQAGESVVSIPRLSVVQGQSGALGFAGGVLASGPLPGGAVELLSIPISGRLAANGELSLWRDCTKITFRRLALAQLNLAGPGVTLCPLGDGPILRSGEGFTTFAATTRSLELKGSLGDMPLALYSDALSVSNAGPVSASGLTLSLGEGEDRSQFEIGTVEATVGETITGTFDAGTVVLAKVPMDLESLQGDFTFADGSLAINDAAFLLNDRENPARFEPLAARGGTLVLADNRIDAEAVLRNPASDREVTRVDIRHNLGTATGHANLIIRDLRFDEEFQPAPSASVCDPKVDPPRFPVAGLSCLALGFVANLEGNVSGKGRIDWNSKGEVTSSGRFSTNNLDFAAAFGPVKGVSGTIEFTDLLNLTTARGQKLRIASVNPGIEAFDGEIEYQLVNRQLLRVSGGSWPFMGGRLILRPLDFNFGVSEERRYIFEIVGLDAGQFVSQMEFENISATGTFDGTVPIIFDRDGNGQIEEGILLSRPPGGNISYVGDLTYEDLSAIGNFAFGALRSLEYSQMGLVMEGPLTGEIITRVRFDGVRQGADADKNFLTRQLAKLPIQFRINIRAQFYQLLTSLKAMYDPSSVRDPRELGLLSDDGTRLRRSVRGEDVESKIEPEDLIPDEPTIQDQESE